MTYDPTSWLSTLAATKTREAYGIAVRRFLAHTGVRKLTKLTGWHLARYRSVLVDAGLAPGTVNLHLAAVRQFLKWTRAVAGEHALSDDIIKQALPSLRGRVLKPYDVLSEEEARTVFDLAQPVERALFALMHGAGLRVSEVTKLTHKDVIEDDGGQALHIRSAKGAKDRIVPLSAWVSDALAPVLDGLPRAASPGAAARIFSGRVNGVDSGRLFPVTPDTIRSKIKRLMHRAGIDRRITPHSLRHTAAISMLRGGANIVAVGKVLGHSSPTVTSRYVDHLTRAELREALPKAP